ncbi:MAG: outer membrane protein transport protein [Kiritimatiellales bacterium]|nr:outer membrane protein transport protein [Kiritimatiellales bacterium]
MKFVLFSLCVAALSLLGAGRVCAKPVAVPTPGGTIFINVSHAGPTGQVAAPEAPQNAGFRPPTVFAAPLPTGSGARALGQAGSFTAVADDATAASWNPAGLTQLERTEASVVYRYSTRTDQHHSPQRDLLTDSDRYSNSELNYISAVYPFLLNGCNAVFSLNYQEAYDFTHAFTASFMGGSSWNTVSLQNQTFHKTTTNHYGDALWNVDVMTHVSTRVESRIDQLLNSSLLTDMEFIQSGTIDAISPAFAIEPTPRLSMGATVNFYTDGASRGNPIRSSLVAEYSGSSTSIAEITETRVSTADIDWSGVQIGGPPGRPTSNPISGSETTAPFLDTETYTQNGMYDARGSYREENRTESFYGVNATLGILWVATDRLTLGAAMDLPWTGRGEQTKRITDQITTVDSNGVQVAQSDYSETQRRDVEYTFPLYWSVGALWRWNDRFYSSMDVSRTHWSDFSYKAEGEERINPLNGASAASSAIDDCWSVRFGSEYLCVLSWTEIPLRGGLFWEQRPAIGSPDEYWGATLGSGISLGKEPGKLILDVAYSFECGENVMGSLLPGQGMTSDTIKHQLFVSAIWHF